MTKYTAAAEVFNTVYIYYRVMISINYSKQSEIQSLFPQVIKAMEVAASVNTRGRCSHAYNLKEILAVLKKEEELSKVNKEYLKYSVDTVMKAHC